MGIELKKIRWIEGLGENIVDCTSNDKFELVYGVVSSTTLAKQRRERDSYNDFRQQARNSSLDLCSSRRSKPTIVDKRHWTSLTCYDINSGYQESGSLGSKDISKGKSGWLSAIFLRILCSGCLRMSNPGMVANFSTSQWLLLYDCPCLWHFILSKCTIKTAFIELKEDFCEYLLQDGLVLPEGVEPATACKYESVSIVNYSNLRYADTCS